MQMTPTTRYPAEAGTRSIASAGSLAKVSGRRNYTICSQCWSSGVGCRSVAECVELVGVHTVGAAAEGENDRQSDGCLGRGDGNREEHEPLAVHRAGLAGKRHEAQVDRVH